VLFVCISTSQRKITLAENLQDCLFRLPKKYRHRHSGKEESHMCLFKQQQKNYPNEPAPLQVTIRLSVASPVSLKK